MASSPGALMAHCLPLLLLLYVTRANAAATPIPPSASSSIKHNTNLPQEIQSSTSTTRSKKESATTPMNSASIIEETEVNTKGPINQRLNRQGKRKNVSALKIPSAIDNHKSKEDMYRNSKFEDSSPNRTRAIFETDSKNKMEEMNTTLSNSTKFGVLQNLGLPPRPRRHPKTTIVPNLNLNKTFSNLTSTQIPLVTTQSKSEGSNSTLRDTRSTISLEAVTPFSTPSDQESYVNVTLEVEDERFDRESELNLDSMFISNTYPTSTVQTDVESQLTTECALGTCRVKDVSSTSSPMETQTQCGDPHAGACSARNVSETVGSSTTVGPNEVPWPIKMAAELPGDLILGGLMMVHEREEEVTCGPVMPQGGVQALEAMLYTLDVLNADPALIPNVTLGAHILDDCDKDTYGLEMAVDFIKDAVRPERVQRRAA